MLFGGAVARRRPEPPYHGSCRGFDDIEVVTDHDHAVVEEHVIVWAQTQDILRDVWPVVWSPERAYVSSLGVHARSDTQSSTAHLAGIFVESLHVAHDRGTPNETLDRRLNSVARLTVTVGTVSLRRWSTFRQVANLELSQAKSADLKA